MFFGGDRASDIVVMLSQEVRELPRQAGFLIRHTWGKTSRVDNPNVFSLFHCTETMICPVLGLKLYLEIAKSMGINLSTGYLFRPRKDN
jgi:hypothetical protein